MTSEADQNNPDLMNKREDTALAARALELDLFWRRALFFWGFIASAFVGLATTYSHHPWLGIAISCFGLVCSFCWTLANRGSKFWYEAWEQVIKNQRLGALFEEANGQRSK